MKKEFKTLLEGIKSKEDVVSKGVLSHLLAIEKIAAKHPDVLELPTGEKQPEEPTEEKSVEEE